MSFIFVTDWNQSATDKLAAANLGFRMRENRKVVHGIERAVMQFISNDGKCTLDLYEGQWGMIRTDALMYRACHQLGALYVERIDGDEMELLNVPFILSNMETRLNDHCLRDTDVAFVAISICEQLSRGYDQGWLDFHGVHFERDDCCEILPQHIVPMECELIDRWNEDIHETHVELENAVYRRRTIHKIVVLYVTKKYASIMAPGDFESFTLFLSSILFRLIRCNAFASEATQNMRFIYREAHKILALYNVHSKVLEDQTLQKLATNADWDNWISDDSFWSKN